MKTIPCNLPKSMSDFRNFHRIIILEYGDTSVKNREISPVYRRIIRSSISLVYVQSIEFVSILTCPSFEGL